MKPKRKSVSFGIISRLLNPVRKAIMTSTIKRFTMKLVIKLISESLLSEAFVVLESRAKLALLYVGPFTVLA